MFTRTNILLATLAIASVANAQAIYWTELDRIRRADLDGSNVEDLLGPSLSVPAGIALDAPAIPTLSESGLLVMAALLLAVGSVVIRRPPRGERRFAWTSLCAKM